MAPDSTAAARALWGHRPVGGRRGSATEGSRAYFDQIRAYRYGYETPFIPEFFRFNTLTGKRVLEIGVGQGIDAVEMIRAGAEYTGIDVTPNHLRLTAENFRTGLTDIERERVQLVEGDLLHTDLGTFDVVYSFGVLHHIDQEASYLRRVRDLLNPGGVLRIGVYSRWSFFNAYLCATWILRARGRTLDDWRSQVAEHSDPGEPVTIKIRSKREVVSVLRSAGFRVVRYRKAGFVQNYLPVIGRRLAPNGATLTACGWLLGWYHCIEATA